MYPTLFRIHGALRAASGASFWVLVCLLGLLAPTARAASTIGLDSPSAGPGEAAMVSVQLQSDGNPVAFQVDVHFDPARLAPGFAEGTALTSRHLVSSSSPARGLARLVIYSLGNAPLSNGIIARLPMRVLSPATAGTASLSLSNVVLASATAARITGISTSPGAVVIRTTAAPTLQRPVLAVNGQVSVRLTGEAGRSYTLQHSEDLRSWQNVATSVATGGTVTFTDTPLPLPRFRFYRALQNP